MTHGCHLRFDRPSSLKAHKAVKHTEERPFECQTCGKAFATNHLLKQHIKIMHTNSTERIVCGIDGCNKRFKNNYLKSHQNLCHLLKFECDYPNCNYTIGNKALFMRHKIQNHTNETPFKCQFEGWHKAFKLEEHYKYHVKTHSTTIITCPHEGCGRTYYREDSLKCHIKIDHSDTWYLCEWPGCEYRTQRKTSLTIHMLSHSSECTVACIWPNCDQMFKTKQNMNNHLLTHKQEKNQICPLPGCDYRCITPGNLKIHMKNRHKDI